MCVMQRSQRTDRRNERSNEQTNEVMKGGSVSKQVNTRARRDRGTGIPKSSSYALGTGRSPVQCVPDAVEGERGQHLRDDGETSALHAQPGVEFVLKLPHFPYGDRAASAVETLRIRQSDAAEDAAAKSD